jgi:hypothetical protein
MTNLPELQLASSGMCEPAVPEAVTATRQCRQAGTFARGLP